MRKLVDWFLKLQGKIGTQRRYQVAFGLCLLGLIIIAASVVLDEHGGPHLLWIVLSEFGIACMIAAIAEFILLEHAKTEFLQEVRQDIKIAAQCWEHQLIDVMAPRKEEPDPALQDINTALKGARGEICIIGASLDDSLLDESLGRVVDSLLLENHNNVSVKLLLIDPKSPAANICAITEEGPMVNPERSRLSHRLRTSIDVIEKWGQLEYKIKAGFCNVLPSFYMISTARDLFIEPCHLEDKSNGRSARSRKTPLFHFSSESEMYRSATSHFSYLWGHLENCNPPAGVLRRKNDSIQVRSTEDVYKEMNRRRHPRVTKIESAA
jgi:hypothetical protein